MPKVDLVATKDFTYNTRRLTAAEPFQARNALDARILTRVRKVAKAPIIGGADVYIPDSRLPSAEEKEPEQPVKVDAPKPAAKKAPAKRKAKARK